VADHLKFFDRVLASDGTTNLSGESKRDRLVGEFGGRGFDYAGNDRSDVAVWASARRVIVVNPRQPGSAYSSVPCLDRVFEGGRGSAIERLKALRPHHWLKNLLIFAPLLAAHRLQEAALFGKLLVAFFAFGCIASSGVRYPAESIGIREIYFGKSPEEKVAILERETRENPTLFVGDGVNDPPAILAATVGVAMGQSNEITAEAAGAVVLESSLEKVDELMHIGRRMRRIALQSAMTGMVMSAVGMLAAALGYLPPVDGAIAQEVIDLLAVLNAVRVDLPAGRLSDL
jgi:hypothetical protein